MNRFVPRIGAVPLAATGVFFAFLLGLSGSPAFARFITMPTTARTWIDIRNNPAGVELDPITGTPIGDSVGQFFASENSIPLLEYDSILPLMAGNKFPNLHLLAEGSVTGNSLESYVSGVGGIGEFNVLGHTPAMTMFTSSNDTYTLTGTPAQVGQSVTLTAHFDVGGTANIFGTVVTPSITAGQVFITAKMGTFNPALSPSLFSREDLRVSPFDAAANAVLDLRRQGQGSVSGIIDLHMSHTFTAIVGTPFDIAYELSIQAFDAFGSFPTTDGFTAVSHAVIDFDVPTGYSFTSQLGWQVPEPNTGVLAVMACGLVWRWRKRVQ